VRVVLTAGGGGHTGYAVALAQRLTGRVELTFIVSEGDLWSFQRVSRFGDVMELPRLRSPDNPKPAILTIHKFMNSLIKSYFKLPQDTVALISTGSNIAIAPALATRVRGGYVVNLECVDRIVTPTKTAKILYKFSNITVLHWEEQLRHYPKAVVVGPIYEKPVYEPYNGGYVLVTAGTYGFKEFFDELIKLDLSKVVVQTGMVDPEPYKRLRPNWIFFRFDPDFSRWIAGADVVVSHLGLTLVNAALGYGKPVITIHNPKWRLAGSREDAKILTEKLNGVFLEEIEASKILRAIKEVEGRKPPKYVDGAEELVKLLSEYLT
jgi:UDP-N-acetylglucosamine--N-acetylmuramyl-(pentapeptide) pyrophosphoryl-undecaprenol N-acetylglucosamine transferase